MHFHIYASHDYLRRFGTPHTHEDLARHKVLVYGEPAPSFLREMNWLENQGPNGGPHEKVILKINSVYGLKQAVQAGVGLAILPDYMVSPQSALVQLSLDEKKLPTFDTYFVYPEELRTMARIDCFRDFLFARAREWAY
ncbi:MAG: hypothetical protein KDJ77_05565 [Rhodobiaceae bacterium]|nr:hypothetical protein [Rhodobiaceae bacterium]